MAKSKVEVPNITDEAMLKRIERLDNADLAHKKYFSKQNIEKEWQEEVPVVAGERWKYFKVTKYKQGKTEKKPVIKRKLIGVVKTMPGTSRRRLIFNHGVDVKKFNLEKACW